MWCEHHRIVCFVLCFAHSVPVASWETIGEVQRENLIADISELFHRQLVTTTLSGNFRNNLESSMRVCQHILNCPYIGLNCNGFFTALQVILCFIVGSTTAVKHWWTQSARVRTLHSTHLRSCTQRFLASGHPRRRARESFWRNVSRQCSGGCHGAVCAGKMLTIYSFSCPIIWCSNLSCY